MFVNKFIHKITCEIFRWLRKYITLNVKNNCEKYFSVIPWSTYYLFFMKLLRTFLHFNSTSYYEWFDKKKQFEIDDIFQIWIFKSWNEIFLFEDFKSMFFKKYIYFFDFNSFNYFPKLIICDLIDDRLF